MPNTPTTSPVHYSLSRYFPEGTEYYYGYPAEEDSHFFNGVSPEIEELVAARPLIIAGPNVKTICFEASLQPFCWNLMHELGSLKSDKVHGADRRHIMVLPKNITARMRGSKRNKLLKEALVQMAHPGRLVMSQPYLDSRLKPRYEIPSNRTIWLNDKRNMVSYIPWQYLPKVYDEFLDGACFMDSVGQLPLPCVVKVTSSSSGDGVRICRTQEDIDNARRDFGKLEGIIMVTELVDMERNFAVQFGIPHDPDQPIEIIRWHEQMVNKNGAFVGGIIEAELQNHEMFRGLNKELLENILPEVRRRGWFGIGGLDVLMSKEGRFYFIDPNFRMTGMTVYDLLACNGDITSSLLSFAGTFEGTKKEFTKIMTEFATVGSSNQKLYLTTLTERRGLFRFNAALLYGSRREIPALAREVLKTGLRAPVLEGLAK